MVRSCRGGDWCGAPDRGDTAWRGAGGVPRFGGGGGHSWMRGPGGLLCACRVAGGGAVVDYGGLRIISWRSAHSSGYSALSGIGRGGAWPRDRWRSPIMLIVYW